MSMTKNEWQFRKGTGGSLQQQLRKRGRYTHVSKPLMTITVPSEDGLTETEHTIVSPQKGDTRRTNTTVLPRRLYRVAMRARMKRILKAARLAS